VTGLGQNGSKSLQVFPHGCPRIHKEYNRPQTETEQTAPSFHWQQFSEIHWYGHLCPNISEKLEKLLKHVNQCPVTRNLKLRICKLGVCSRLHWFHVIYHLSLTRIECQLQPPSTKLLKKWAGLVISANPNILYLLQKEVELGLPLLLSLTKLFKCLISTSSSLHLTPVSYSSQIAI